ncbi:MAG: glutamate formimidoyltransferase [Gemmatimonadaceae bacterium]|nr:glutamate formimidoyltransferase [Gemmatimonadaceae bacterium]
MAIPLVECVPNFSEGRDPAVIDAIAAAITAAGGRVLDHSLDPWHHRAVITFVAGVDVAVAAAFAAIRTARDRIDLRQHAGVHPRIGAADVVPFIPLSGATMDDCVRIARTLADRVGTELQLPAYLYDRAAQRAAYRNLADVRAGGTAALEATIGSTRPPDAGPAALHPTAGAVAIGARDFLGAFNVYVGHAAHLPQAKAIARELRAAGGGLPGVKALGLVVDGQAQVSMNVTDLAAVSLHEAFDAVARAAAARGITATHSEIIGLVPQHEIERAFTDRIRLRDARDTVSLDLRIHATRDVTDLSATADAIAALDASEASGTAAALSAILAAATVRLAAGVHAARRDSEAATGMARAVDGARTIERHLHAAARDDAAAWQGVVRARRALAADPHAMGDRHRAIDAALLGASDVPLRIARLASDTLALALETATAGDAVTAPDAWAGACMAHAAVHAALGLLRGNLAMLRDQALSHAAHAESRRQSHRADTLLGEVRTAVGHVAGPG